jgi:AmmeMemoRadiSam system protein A
MLSDIVGEFLLRLAREAIEKYVKEGKIISPPERYPKDLDQKSGVFVTLHKVRTNGALELRGCIGLPYPHKRLIEGVIEAAVSATEDPRFLPLREDELEKIKIEVSVLSKPEELKVTSPEELLKKLKPKVDGLIIQKGIMSGLFLPQVWEEIPDKEKFLEALCYKAGLRPDAWKDPSVKFYRFTVQIFKEK